MYKSKLQELCHQYAWMLPEYATVKDGPDHSPLFAATVTVNGISFESPKDQCRSSKEAQNLAANIAYHHFTGPKSILSNPLPAAAAAAPLPAFSSPPPSAGASTSNGKVHVGSPIINILQRRQNNSGQLSGVNEAPLAGRDASCSKGIVHLYKNRLQHYAQKQNLTLPAYSSELDGPPHARRFRSKVTIDGKTFESHEFFSTLKEAEHAAAKVAFESLAPNDNQEDQGLYKTLLQDNNNNNIPSKVPHEVGSGKTLLQELAHKEGLHLPSYDTARAGPSHMPIFLSVVEVGGRTFKGQEAKTKKQAEMNVAKLAYNTLVTRGQLDESRNVLPASSGAAAAATNVSEPVQQKSKLMIEQLNLHKEEAASNGHSSGSTTVLHHLTDSVSESANSATSTLPSEKILIFPRNANVELPAGASILPCSDEKWVAASLALNRNQLTL